MNGISFNMANYVARQTDWNMIDWGHGDRTSSDYFRPADTFGERFAEYLQDIKGLGFDAVDMWSGIIDPRWATAEHISTARDLLKQYGIAVYSFGGYMGDSANDFVEVCELASQLGAPILGGMPIMLYKDRPFVVSTLQKYGLKLGIENHPEKTPGELLAKIGDGGENTVGACVDTGWFGTQGYDAAEALDKLDGHLFIVHLKDVREVEKHETCRFGDGVVPVERCVQVLKRTGYTGTLSIEHEPNTYNPNKEIAESLAMLKGWLAE